jgi:hypothetical protein
MPCTATRSPGRARRIAPKRVERRHADAERWRRVRGCQSIGDSRQKALVGDTLGYGRPARSSGTGVSAGWAAAGSS